MRITITQVEADSATLCGAWVIDVATEDEADAVMKRVEDAIGSDFSDLTALALTTTRDISSLANGSGYVGDLSEYSV